MILKIALSYRRISRILFVEDDLDSLWHVLKSTEASKLNSRCLDLPKGLHPKSYLFKGSTLGATYLWVAPQELLPKRHHLRSYLPLGFT